MACTLLELFTANECWEIPEDDTEAQDFIINDTKKGETPPSLQYLNDAFHDSQQSLKIIIKKCFTYIKGERPHAIDIVEALTS